MSGWTDRCIDHRWGNGWINGGMDEWMDEWMDRWISKVERRHCNLVKSYSCEKERA